MRSELAASVVVAGVAVAVAGCGDRVTVTKRDGTGTGVGTDTGADVSTMTGTSTSTSTSTSTGTGAHDCWTTGTEDDCWSCCVDEESKAATEIGDIYKAKCLCGPEAPCDSVCSDVYCPTETPDLDCEDCSFELGEEHPCVLETFEECAADPECAPFSQCGSGCGDLTGTGSGTDTGVYDECWNQPPSGCLGCCETTYDQALTELEGFFFDECICGAGAPCALACEVHCQDLNQPADAPCQACIDSLLAGSEDCVGDAWGACSVEESCVPIVECLGGC